MILRFFGAAEFLLLYRHKHLVRNNGLMGAGVEIPFHEAIVFDLDSAGAERLLEQHPSGVFFVLYCQAGTKKKLKKLSKADINEKFQKEKVTTNYTLVSRECPNSPIKRCSTSA